ncbi:DNA polymerase III subunit delta', partial [uncultured Halovibrio sp.]|uniref:DNA polymerase III subunit delta' n=1 Tax=uncultured Halovibrio sp. TaxID=985049 RepID=UPI0025F73422
MADPETQPLQSDSFAPWPWQSEVHQQLSQRLKEGRFPHALMLLGPAGVGKRQLAVALASLLLCEAPVNAGKGMTACGECKQCRLLGGEGHPDARRLMPTDQSRYIRIHQVRALGGFVMESPQVAQRKVAVIERADQLNLNAANALLKTLEEPPADTFLLVLQREGQPVLPTIRSRCQILRVEAPETAEARTWLAERRDEDAAGLDQALRWAGGAPLEALRLLSNLETDDSKLLQLVLFGQPELDANLDANEIRQLRERITHSFHLEPLVWRDVAQYLNFRLRAVGYRGPDLFDHLERTGAPMMPRDVGLVIGETGAQAGDRVLDAGTGTGVLAGYLGRLGAQVTTYERDPDFAEVARENVATADVGEAVTVRTGDLVAALDDLADDDGFDLVTLDTEDAPAVVERTPDLLVPGGFLAVYSPFVEQARDVVRTAREVDLAAVESVETIQR